MGAFDDVLNQLGASPDAGPQPQGYGTPPRLLDNLRQVESSGNRYAVNQQTGAMGPYQFMPSTVASLHKQGVQFDPFDEGQARNAADYLISQLAAQNGGDYHKAMAAYGGFKTADPTSYVTRVLSGVQANQQQPQPSQGQQPGAQPAAGAFDQVLLQLTRPPQAQPAAVPQAQSSPATNFPRGRQSRPNNPNSPGLWEGIKDLASIPIGAGETALSTISGTIAQPVAGIAGLLNLGATGNADQAADRVNQVQNALTYQPRTQAGQQMTQVVAAPFNALGQAADASGQWVSDTTGSPAAGAALRTAMEGAPAILGARAALAKARPGSPEAQPMPQGAPHADPGSAAGPIPMAAAGSPDMAVPGQPGVPAGAAQGMADTGSTRPTAAVAKDAQGSPVFSQATGEAPEASGKSLSVSAPEQEARKAVLRRIGLTDARESAITGNVKDAGTDFQTAKLDGPVGDTMSRQIDAEQAALRNHAAGIVQDTGGTIGMDQTAAYERGTNILNALNGIRDWFDGKIKDFYGEARQKAADQGVDLNSTGAMLGDDAQWIAHTDTINLRNGILARMKTLGMLDDDGNPLPTTVDNLERLRQYVGEKWTPQAGGVVRGFKAALDDDVTSAAGADTFANARAMRTARARTLDNPNGVAKLMDSDNQTDINRRVPIEKIGDTIGTLPVDQLQHVLDTLRNAPPQTQPLAQRALADIKSQFTGRIAEIGGKPETQWNAPGVSQFLASNRERLGRVFNDRELANLQDLNDAGRILRMRTAYPGAVVQGANLARRGIATLISSAATGAGGLVGSIAGPVGSSAGAVWGGAAGKAIGGRVREAGALKATQQRISPLGGSGSTRLRDILP